MTKSESNYLTQLENTAVCALMQFDLMEKFVVYISI